MAIQKKQCLFCRKSFTTLLDTKYCSKACTDKLELRKQQERADKVARRNGERKKQEELAPVPFMDCPFASGAIQQEIVNPFMGF